MSAQWLKTCSTTLIDYAEHSFYEQARFWVFGPITCTDELMLVETLKFDSTQQKYLD